MDQRQLANFLCVCEEKSISKAAKRCFITQQGLSFIIKQLEEELDVPLFDRTPQGLELTEFGRALKIAATGYVDHHNNIIDSIRMLKNKMDYLLPLGIRSGLHSLLPKYFLKDFFDLHPETVLDLRTFYRHNCQEEMLKNHIHIGISNERVEGSFFETFPCQGGKIVLITGKGHPLASRGPVKLSELRKENLVGFRDPQNPQNIFTKIYEDSGLMPDNYIEPFDVDLFFDLCSTNQFVFLGVEPFDSFSEFAAIPIEDLDIKLSLYIIVQKNICLNGVEKSFSEYAKKTLQTYTPSHKKNL